MHFLHQSNNETTLLLIGKPIAVTNGIHGSCVITCSYEARAFGIKTGMRYVDAKSLCPTLFKNSLQIQ
ncbi:MAG: hypothetical protein Ct9H90mP18_06520 [Gammaproteobacteria bacterium]|nr:MAG: hypothetical protein Ct9H90mP18_06520 [Gammaproteobacteria bacterium]